MQSKEDSYVNDTKFIIERYEQIEASGNRQRAIKLSLQDIQKIK